MTKIAAYEVTEVGDPSTVQSSGHVVVPLNTRHAGQFALAVQHLDLQNVITGLADALAAFPHGPDIPRLMLEPASVEVGITHGNKKPFISFRMPAGGLMNFAIDPTLAKNVHRALGKLVAAVDETIPPDATRQ